MPQVFLAICAILAFSIFALNQHRSDNHIDQLAIASEVELAATDVARDQLTRIASLAFDEVDVDRSGIRLDATGLSPIGPDAGESDPSLYDDIDDFHNFVDTMTVQWHGLSLNLAYTAEIRYVNPDSPTESSATPTLAKEIAITVGEVDAPTERDKVLVRLLQVLTPAWKAMHG